MAHDPELEALADRLHSLAIHLLRQVREVDAMSGLSAARLSALSVLVFAGPRTVGELAATEQVSAPTMSKLLSALEADGLATRESDPEDARRVRVHATRAGSRALQKARARRVARMSTLLEGLTPTERRVVARAVALIEERLAGGRG